MWIIFIPSLWFHLCRHYIHKCNRHCKCRLLAFHNHICKCHHQQRLHSHMLDLSCKMDHVHGFKTLSKKSQRYTSFLLILSVIPKIIQAIKKAKNLWLGVIYLSLTRSQQYHFPDQIQFSIYELVLAFYEDLEFL